jgi:hypothetical protein
MRTIAAVVLAAVAAVALTGCAAAPAQSMAAFTPAAAGAEIDWAAAAGQDFTDCPAEADAASVEVDDVTYADLTGDGHDEALVVAVCLTLPGSDPARVFVYDGNRLLLTVGDGDRLTSSEVRVSGRTLTVASLALSDDDPRCCPDLAVTEAWTWTGGDFERTARTVKRIG